MTTSICVFCGSNMGNSPIYEDAADALGREIAARGMKLVYGGGGLGLMGTLINAARDVGCETLGILPDFLSGYHNNLEALGDHILVDDMFERKALMLEQSDCFAVLPGGIGTYDEFFEIIAWKQLGQARQNIGMLNINKFFDPLLELISHGVKEGFIRQSIEQSIYIENRPEDLVSKLMN